MPGPQLAHSRDGGCVYRADPCLVDGDSSLRKGTGIKDMADEHPRPARFDAPGLDHRRRHDDPLHGHPRGPRPARLARRAGTRGHRAGADPAYPCRPASEPLRCAGLQRPSRFTEYPMSHRHRTALILGSTAVLVSLLALVSQLDPALPAQGCHARLTSLDHARFEQTGNTMRFDGTLLFHTSSLHAEGMLTMGNATFRLNRQVVWTRSWFRP